MQKVLVIAGMLAALAGCSPLQMCLADADQGLREVTRALQTHRDNLSRGYAIERIQVPELVPGFCPGPGGGPVACTRWDT